MTEETSNTETSNTETTSTGTANTVVVQSDGSATSARHDFSLDSDPIANVQWILNNYDRIGVFLSGGADSALGLYLLQKHNVDTQILPIHGHDISRRNRGQTNTSDLVTQRVLTQLRTYFPEKNHLLQDLHVFEYDLQDGERKSLYNKPVITQMCSDGRIQHEVSFVTANPPSRIHSSEEPDRSNATPTNWCPWFHVNKRWVATKYQEYGLLSDLFPLTWSCTSSKDSPCQSCYWCIEKYWAFGAFDGGTPNLSERRVL